MQLVVIPECGCLGWPSLDKGTVAGSPSENGMGLLIPVISAVPMVTGAVFPKQTTVGCLSVAAHT